MFSFSLCGCGPICWEALDDKCSCSCGGVNHGSRRNRPQCAAVAAELKRQMVYAEFLWELVSVAAPVRDLNPHYRMEDGRYCMRPSNLDDDASARNQAAGIKSYNAHRSRDHYGKLPVAIVRPFTASQIAKWPELEIWRAADIHPKSFVFYGKPGGLWQRMDELTATVKATMAKKAAPVAA